MTELFQSGQANIAVWRTGRVQAFANTGFPVDFIYPKEGAPILRLGLSGRQASGQSAGARDDQDIALGLRCRTGIARK